MTNLSSLIERLESATEGSRELDAEIHRVLGWELAPPEAGVTWWGDAGSTFDGPLPTYTTSLDSALTLVDRSQWRVEIVDWTCEGGTSDNGGTKLEHCNPFVKIPDNGYVWARTPPLSVCAAALRARQHEAG